MTTFDKLVTTDLAALASDSRRQLPAADDLLRAIDARRTGGHRDAVPAASAGELALVRFAGVFAHRVARTAMGAAALVCTLVLLVAVYGPGFDRQAGWPAQGSWWLWVLDHDVVSIGASIVLVMLATYVIASRLARGWFERGLRGAPGDAAIAWSPGRRLACSLDRGSIVFGIAGVTCAVTLIGVMAFTLGRERWEIFLYDHNGPDVGAVLDDRLRDLTVAVASIVAAAIVVARVCTHPRGARWAGWLGRRVTAVTGIIVGVFTLGIGVARDLGPLSWNNDFATPATALRTALTATGAFAVFVVMTSLTLGRRRRDARETGEGAARGPEAAALVSLAGVFERRVARAAGGAMAAVCAVVLLVVLHNPFGDEPIRREIIDLVDQGVPWQARWFRDGAMIATVIGILVCAAHLLGARIAARRFARRIHGLGADSDARAPGERAGRLVRGADAWSVGLGIAGAASVATLFSVIGPSIGAQFWTFFQPHSPRVAGVVLQALREVSVAVPIDLAVAAAVGHACARESGGHRTARWILALEHRLVVPVGLALGLVAGYAGATVDFGVFDISFPAAGQPPAWVHTALTLLSTTSILLVTVGYTLRRRRQEHARIG